MEVEQVGGGHFNGHCYRVLIVATVALYGGLPCSGDNCLAIVYSIQMERKEIQVLVLF